MKHTKQSTELPQNKGAERTAIAFLFKVMHSLLTCSTDSQ